MPHRERRKKGGCRETQKECNVEEWEK